MCSSRKYPYLPPVEGIFPKNTPPPHTHTHPSRNFSSASYISLVFALTESPSPGKFQSRWGKYGFFLDLYNTLRIHCSSLIFNDTRCFDVTFVFISLVACSAAHPENKGKYHQHVKFSGTDRSARSCCICGNQGKPQSSMFYFHLHFFVNNLSDVQTYFRCHCAYRAE